MYFPLGGSRRGFARTLRNTLIVFALSGLWHGASWTFVVWGLLHALYLCAELIWNRAPPQRPQGTRPLLQGASVAENLCPGVYRVDIFRGGHHGRRPGRPGDCFCGTAAPPDLVAGCLPSADAGGTLTGGYHRLSVLVLLLGDLLDEKNDAMAAVGRLRPAARYALYVVFLLGILLLIPKTTGSAVYLFPVLRRLADETIFVSLCRPVFGGRRAALGGRLGL